MINKILGATFATVLSIAGVASANGDQPMKFTIRIENISKPDMFIASNGTKWSLAFSPGIAVVHTDMAPIFASGRKDRGQGLEAQAEDGDPSVLAKSLANGKGIKSVTVFNTPVGASAPGPITPGAGYEVTVSAMPGDRLSLTLMMGQSNDWFYAPRESGIELYKNGKTTSGDITSQISMWDAGTEVNEEPGIGPNQGPRQKAANTGKEENATVHKIQDGKAYSKPSEVMRITINPAMPAM
jgi:hypothetical protein